MLFLMEKTSRGARLDTAAQRWKQTYNIVDSRKFHSLMKQFDKLHVNPVTLTSKGKAEIPCLRSVQTSLMLSGYEKYVLLLLRN